MAISTNDFAALTEYLNDLFVETSANRVASDVGMNLFGVTADPYQSYTHQVLHGIAGIKKITEGQDFPAINGKEGDSITWTQSQFGGLVSITKVMRQFDRYNEIENRAKSIIDDAYDCLDQSFADMLLNGWSTSYTDVYGNVIASVGPDGLALFSASHTNGATASTYSNLIVLGSVSNPELSRAAVIATITKGRKYKDVNGLARPIDLDTLIVGPDNADLADRIVNSTGIQGSANNDTNGMMLRRVKVIVWDRLASTSAGTDTSAYWFMANGEKVKESLQAKFSQYPRLDAPNEVYENKNWEYTLDYFYSRGLGFAAYIYGSKGTNAA